MSLRRSWVVVGGWLVLWSGLLVAAEPAPRTDLHGDPLPEGAVARLGTVRLRHGHALTSVALSADGKVLVAGGHEDVLRIWDTAEGKLLRTLPAPPGPPTRLDTNAWFYNVAVSADGTLTAGCGSDQVLHVWEVDTGKELWHQHFVGSVQHMKFSPDGKLLAGTRNDYSFVLWQAVNGELVRQFTGHTHAIYSLAFSSDGKMLASGSQDYTARAWDVETGKELFKVTGQPFAVTAVALSRDGKKVATASGGNPDPVVRLWDLATGKRLQQVEGDLQGTASLAFTSDDKELAILSALENRIRFVDPQTGKETRRLDVPPGRTWSLSLSADGKTLAAGGTQKTIMLWDAKTGKERFAIDAHQGPVAHLAFSADGRSLMTAGRDGIVRRWDLTKFTERDRLGVKGTVFGLPAGGSLAVSGDFDGFVHLYDPATGKELRSFKASDLSLFQGVVSANGKLLATNAIGDQLVLADVEKGEKARPCAARANQAKAMALTPDGSLLATHEPDNALRLWDTATGRERRRVQDFSMLPNLHLAFSADGRLLSGGGADGSARLYETLTGKKFWQFNGHNREIVSQAFSPDGRTLAVGDWGGVHVWDLRTGRERGVLKGHLGDVLSVAFSPDGKVLASGGADTAVLLWDLEAVPPAPAPAELTAKDVDRLWSELTSTEGTPAVQAVFTLAGSPKQAVPFLTARLQPVPAVPAERLQKWLADLESDDAATARQAMTELEPLGRQIETPLRKALAKATDADAKLRINVLLSKLNMMTESAEQRQALRGVHALELAATPEAKAHLAKLAEGATEAELTREARAAHDRLARRGESK